jgi:HK97 family phage major capsid protein
LRAYSLLEIKRVDPVQRVVEGIASTPEVDMGGDSMVPEGARFKLPMPFLWEHDASAPIGQVFAATVKPDGIHIKARISTVPDSAPPSLKERLDLAWASISANPPLVRGLSIGWKALKSAPLAGVKGGRLVSEWLWGETSAVTIPMNAGAMITSVKSLAQFDRASAASGASSVPSTPGVSGSSQQKTKMKNISEQLTTAKAALATKSARLEELMTEDEQGGGLEQEKVTERETLVGEVKSLTAKVDHLTTLERAQASAAQSLAAATGAAAPVTGRTPHVEFKRADLPKGTLFTRVALALAAGRGSLMDSMEFAKQWGNTPEVGLYIKHGFHRKAAEPGMADFASPGWGSQLAAPNTILTEFVELLRAETIIGKVPNFRRVPFNIPIITQTGGSTVGWVGEGSPKGVGELAFDNTTLGKSKVAGILVLSEDLIRLSNPSAEALARTDLVEQTARFLDEQFIRVSVSANGLISPASITNGENSPSATGTTAAALRHDLNVMLKVFTDAHVPTRGNVIVMTSALARGISLLTTTLGVPEFPTMTPEGGTLLGYQVIVSDSVDSGTMVMFQPREIFLADDGAVTIDASREATLDMNGSTSPSFSLWQNNCVGLRAEQWIRWQKRRGAATSVAVVDTAAYAPA